MNRDEAIQIVRNLVSKYIGHNVELNDFNTALVVLGLNDAEVAVIDTPVMETKKKKK